MTTFDSELLDCLEIVLGERPPDADYETLRFLKHWLGGRNLGLVPIADASAFDWPGHWIARVHAADGDHAVVMFGSPSGPLHDPAGALAGGGTIAEGWLLARLDVHLPIEEPEHREANGVVEAILVAAAAEQPLHRVERVAAIAGRGLEGDRYYEGRGTFSAPGRGYELTLVEAEVLDEIGLAWEEARRNVVTRGIELNALVGRRFTIGKVVCVGRRLAEPCAHLERVSRPNLLRPLVHRAGIRADILESDTIAVGDSIEAID
jgi:MOSC domain